MVHGDEEHEERMRKAMERQARETRRLLEVGNVIEHEKRWGRELEHARELARIAEMVEDEHRIRTWWQELEFQRAAELGKMLRDEEARRNLLLPSLPQQQAQAAINSLQMGAEWLRPTLRQEVGDYVLNHHLPQAVQEILSGVQHSRGMILELSHSFGRDLDSLETILRAQDFALLHAAGVRSAIAEREAGLMPEVQRVIEAFDVMAGATSDIWQLAEAQPQAWLDAPSFLWLSPAISTYEAARSTGGLVGLDEPLLEGPNLLGNRGSAEEGLVGLLRTLNEDFVERYLGARKAEARGGPDWFRQASTSWRELLNDLLVILAPDEAVSSQSPPPERNDDGSPTRRARIAYILDEYGTEYSAFSKADVDHICGTIAVLNRGTHGPGNRLNEKAKRQVMDRAHYAVECLLLAALG